MAFAEPARAESYRGRRCFKIRCSATMHMQPRHFASRYTGPNVAAARASKFSDRGLLRRGDEMGRRRYFLCPHFTAIQRAASYESRSPRRAAAELIIIVSPASRAALLSKVPPPPCRRPTSRAPAQEAGHTMHTAATVPPPPLMSIALAPTRERCRVSP